MDEIHQVFNDDLDLRKSPKVYKKIYKYYKELGAGFTGDSQYDYNIIVDCLYEDLIA